MRLWKKHFHSGSKQQISEAIKKAESEVSVEIVPMVVDSSTGFDHIKLILFLIFIILGWFALDLAPLDRLYPLKLVHMQILVLLLSFILSRLLARHHFVQRLFTSGRDMHHSVEKRAQLEFLRLHIDQTKAHNGILLFLSLRERKAVVLVDHKIASKIDNKEWQTVIHSLVKTAGEKDLTDGVIAAIEKCVEVVNPHFKNQGAHSHELPDRLIVKH